MIAIPTMTMAMIMPIVAGTKYMSATDTGCGVAVGAVVGSAPTPK